ncbi:hypothetical protein [Natronorubrum bangense]|uniref:DUF7993 domain-containing protein n=2 Tax=Natronorubrum bangense TaxID=61858 RepID=A0A4D6HGR9_9EURY|nr:hypothetical protein [Natronorubrum bangense]ELY44023.1 hypothetical protein C494_18068 [Natronorubrum bangense JCM 10635]QCC53053.1 hypothetical protein DV706_00285 [Natronorubrum bangense]QCC56254.1 hypothetical protein DV706_16985 [Natronorubrum bangense]
MVEERITDGRRIAELLASELDGREDGVLESVQVMNADRDVEPTVDGERAYDVTVADERIAQVFVHDDRARLEFEAGQDVAAETAKELELRVRPKATEPPRTLVFVEHGAAVKRGSDVVQAVCRSLQTDSSE